MSSFFLSSDVWESLLRGIEDFQIFSLSEQFSNLSLHETNSLSSNETNSFCNLIYGDGEVLNTFLRSFRHSMWNQYVNEQLRAPFIEFPRAAIEALYHLPNLQMSFGFRFHPVQRSFILNKFNFSPVLFRKFTFISNSLGLSFRSNPITSIMLLNSSHTGAGLRAAIDRYDNLTGLLVEVITHYKGMYGRFLVLVSLGIGCTVWYGFAPGDSIHPPVCELFSPLRSYNPYFHVDYFSPIFRKISFVETKDLTEQVMSALENEYPFAEINIPASNNVLKAVGLGVMVAFFLAVGIVPNVPASSHISIENLQR